MTLDAWVAVLAAEIDRLAARCFAAFVAAVAEWDHDARTVALAAWQTTWAAERAAMLDRVREDGRATPV